MFNAIRNDTISIRTQWFLEENKVISLNREVHMHPFTYCHFVHEVAGSDAALDMLQKYLHQKIDGYKRKYKC